MLPAVGLVSRADDPQTRDRSARRAASRAATAASPTARTRTRRRAPPRCAGSACAPPACRRDSSSATHARSAAIPSSPSIVSITNARYTPSNRSRERGEIAARVERRAPRGRARALPRPSPDRGRRRASRATPRSRSMSRNTPVPQPDVEHRAESGEHVGERVVRRRGGRLVVGRAVEHRESLVAGRTLGQRATRRRPRGSRSAARRCPRRTRTPGRRCRAPRSRWLRSRPCRPASSSASRSMYSDVPAAVAGHRGSACAAANARSHDLPDLSEPDPRRARASARAAARRRRRRSASERTPNPSPSATIRRSRSRSATRRCGSRASSSRSSTSSSARARRSTSSTTSCSGSSRNVRLGFMGMKNAGKRFFAGLQIFISTAQGPGNIAMSREAPGQIVALRLRPGQVVDVREHQFLLATHAVELRLLLAAGPGQRLLLAQRAVHRPLSAATQEEGLLLLHGYGNVFEKQLAPGRAARRRARRVAVERRIGADGHRHGAAVRRRRRADGARSARSSAAHR